MRNWKVIRTALTAAWSKKQTTSVGTNFVPVTGPINTANVKNVRISQYAESNSGKASVRHGYNMSDDGINWSTTVTALGQFITTTGWFHSTAAQTVSTNQKGAAGPPSECVRDDDEKEGGRRRHIG
jgi:hypothetical protein